MSAARAAQGFAKMTPGTMAGQSRAATPPARQPRLSPPILNPCDCAPLTECPILDMRFWFKADSLSVTLTDGDPVATWPDSSGNGHDGIQTVADRRPTFHPLGQAGQPVCPCPLLSIVTFDGNHSMDAVNVFPITGGLWTSFAVASRVGTTGAMCIASSDVNGSNRGPKWAAFDSLSAVSVAFDTANNGYVDLQSGVSADTFCLISAVRDGSSVETFLNGSSGGSTATAGTPEPGISNTPLGLGNDPRGPYPAQMLIGDIAEVIGFPYAMSAAERGQMETYLTTKYAAIL